MSRSHTDPHLDQTTLSQPLGGHASCSGTDLDPDPHSEPFEPFDPRDAQVPLGSTKIQSWIPNRPSLLVLPLFAAFCFVVYRSYFLCDDAFISFRYVRNLVEGRGLVFNVGEAVEGYTNFLWVLQLAGLWKIFGIRPEIGSILLSMLATGGVFALVCSDAGRSAREVVKGRLMRAMALGLLLTSTTFAIWTTSGLETRQFTLFSVAAIMAAGRYQGWSKGALVSSICCGLAALSRPEGLLVGCMCIGFMTLDSMWRETFHLKLFKQSASAFVAVVAGHFLFRYAYYDQWLPNTYYAKHVRPWHESGFDYFTAASVETGLYLLVPLACLGTWMRWRHRNDRSGVLYMGFLAAHAMYLIRVGGDHFEFRPLDVYWPLLAPLAVEGLCAFVATCMRALRGRFDLRIKNSAVVLSCYGVLLFYCSAFQLHLLLNSQQRFPDGRPLLMNVQTTGKNAPVLFALPFGQLLAEIANPARGRGLKQLVGTRLQEHRLLGKLLHKEWSDLEDAKRPLLPPDAVASMAMVGVMPFFLPDATIIDTKGLTDATVARNHVEVKNSERYMAHDRNPPKGYLRERGVNFLPHPPKPTQEEALKIGLFAVQADADTWLPFDALDHDWVHRGFAKQRVAFRQTLSAQPDRPQEIRFNGKTFVPRQVITSFEKGRPPGWSSSGAVLTGKAATSTVEQDFIYGRVGDGIATTFGKEGGDQTQGRLRSSPVRYQEGDWFFALLSGGNDPCLGLDLWIDGKLWRTFRSHHNERLDLVGAQLPTANQRAVTIELRDDCSGGWGHLNLDHLMLARPAD